MIELLEKLQEDYLQNKTNLDELSKYLLVYTTEIINKIKNKKHIYMEIEEIQELSNIIVGDIVRKYIEKEDFKINKFFSYIYRAVKNKLYDKFYKKSYLDIADYENVLKDKTNIEDDYIRKEQEEELLKQILNIINNYVKDYPEETQVNIYTHFINSIGRRKSIQSYLYNIKDKKTRLLFIDVMAEVKAYLQRSK